MKKVSIIILETNELQLDKCLSHIKKQSMSDEIERIILNNRTGRFSSAAEGLNYGARIAKGDILIFMHQDFYIEDNDAILKYYTYLIKNSNAIIGPAGVNKNGLPITDISETEARIRRGVRANGKVMEVYSLDECMFAMSKCRWEMLGFDETTCNNWHCYAVDICYQNLIYGGINVLYPIDACHASTGNANTKEFRASIKKMLVKYYKIPQINKLKGTCIDIPCRYTSYYLWIFKCHIKNILAFFLRKNK